MRDNVACKVRLTGNVQGVFFRAWTRDEARRLGVAGWVRNCGDGSVEARLEGKPEAVEELIEHMRKGPPGARVQEVQVKEVGPEELTGFEVRH